MSAGNAFQRARLLAVFHLVSLALTVFGLPFWRCEQWRARLQDDFANRGESR
jgi:hypothetical protein